MYGPPKRIEEDDYEMRFPETPIPQKQKTSEEEPSPTRVTIEGQGHPVDLTATRLSTEEPSRIGVTANKVKDAFMSVARFIAKPFVASYSFIKGKVTAYQTNRANALKQRKGAASAKLEALQQIKLPDIQEELISKKFLNSEQFTGDSSRVPEYLTGVPEASVRGEINTFVTEVRRLDEIIKNQAENPVKQLEEVSEGFLAISQSQTYNILKNNDACRTDPDFQQLESYLNTLGQKLELEGD